MYVYQMSFPIDYFGVMRQFKDVYNDSIEDEKLHPDEYSFKCPMTHRELQFLLRRSLRSLARMRTYWEGDVRSGELYIGSVPGDDDYNDSHYFITLKQDNNGSSYIISEVEFAHLHESLVEERLGAPVKQSILDGIKSILDKYAPSSEPEGDGCFKECL